MRLMKHLAAHRQQILDAAFIEQVGRRETSPPAKRGINPQDRPVSCGREKTTRGPLKSVLDWDQNLTGGIHLKAPLLQEFLRHLKTTAWRAQVRAVADVLDNGQRAAPDSVAHVFPHSDRCEQIVVRLHDKGRRTHPCEVCPVIGKKCDVRKMPGDIRIGSAKTVRQFSAQFRLIWCTHDRGSHIARPAQIVIIECLKQILDVASIETADVATFVDERRRWSDHDVGGKQFGSLDGSKHSDHRADGMAHINDRGLRIARDDFKNIVGVAVKRSVLAVIVERQIRVAAPHQIE